MAHTIVSRQQYVISDHGITHTPTGYSFTPYAGNPSSGRLNKGRLGDLLPSGEDYRPYEVEEMARQLWEEFVKQHKLARKMG